MLAAPTDTMSLVNPEGAALFSTGLSIPIVIGAVRLEMVQ
jgi:hypothetical protein